MKTFYSHKHNCPSLNQTSTSFYPYGLAQNLRQRQQKSYLTSMNYHLLNEITDSQTEKNYYRTKMTQQFHDHHSELENAFSTISQKNQFIIQLEQQLDRMKKDFRILSDQYVGLKNTSDSQRQLHKTQMEVLKRKHEQQLRKIEEEAQKRVEMIVNKRITEIQTQCQKRVDMFKKQLQQSRQNSNQIAHELKLLQEDYKQVMLKNDTIIQQSIHRELRKRDFQAQNNYLRDVAQYEHLKKVNQELKDQISKYHDQIKSLQQDKKRYKASNIVLQTKLQDLQAAFQHQKKNNHVKLQEKYKQTEQMQTNTQQNYVPILLPVDNNIVGEIISLKQFLAQKMISKYEQFFTKASLKQKKKSASLITFKNFLAEQIKNAQENSLLIYVYNGLERIVKLYCPSMSYTRQFLTIKDEFIRKTLMECQGLTNKQQKLFRLLELMHRLHHPITHVKSEVSTGQVKMVEIKILTTLKKIFQSFSK